MMVTRQNTDEDMGEQLIFQMFDNPKALMITAAILGVMGIVPGMPHFSFLSLAAVAGGAAYWLIRSKNKKPKNRPYPPKRKMAANPFLNANCHGMMYNQSISSVWKWATV